MIRAGMRPQEYADAIRDERARRAAEGDPARRGDGEPDPVNNNEQPASAVDIAPRSSSD